MNPQKIHLALNPGSGPVAGAALHHAEDNMQAWLDEHPFEDMASERHQERDKGGRYGFLCRRAGKSSTYLIEMPGLPLDQVRYTGPPQNIWDFPRLYVDGSSWVWCYSLLDDEDYWTD